MTQFYTNCFDAQWTKTMFYISHFPLILFVRVYLFFCLYNLNTFNAISIAIWLSELVVLRDFLLLSMLSMALNWIGSVENFIPNCCVCARNSTNYYSANIELWASLRILVNVLMKDISDQVSFFSAPCQLPFPYLWTQTNMAITWNGCNRFIYAVHMELHSATLCIHI